MSFNNKNGKLGVDFNWRTDDIGQIIADLEKALPFITVKFYGKEHRFKYKLTTSMVGFGELQNRLLERFQDISCIDDPSQHCIRISLPCKSVKYYNDLRITLEKELSFLPKSCNIIIDQRVPGKVRVPIYENEESKIEDIKGVLKNMRKVDFGFEIGGKIIPFGHLLSVKYPRLTFDIDVSPSDKESAVFEYLEKKSVRFVVPILTGDIEKISRLKKTFSMATSGDNLCNDNLQKFIFDSSFAEKTDNIDYILRRDGEPYNELCEHLINSKVNESQKDAILKCIFAKDMAIIQGPPGSGKSTAIAELIWQLIRYGFKQGRKKERILLTSETNLAVDNAISKIINKKMNLVKPIRFGGDQKLESEGLQFSIDMMKKWVEMGNDALVFDGDDENMGQVIKIDLVLNNWLSNISNRSFCGITEGDNKVISRWKNVLANPCKEIRKNVFERYVESCNVIGATCSSIGDTKSDGKGSTSFFRSYKEVFKPKGHKLKIEFTTVIQDESSKATLAELVLPFVYGNRAIVIGDHRQLPPMLDREEMENTLSYALEASDNQDEKGKNHSTSKVY